MAKSALRAKARKFRQDGLGVKTIAAKLHVSSSTVSLWCRDIILTPEQIVELERRSHDPYYGRRLSYVKKQQKERAEKTQHLLKKGIKEVGHLTTKELFYAGVSLYWAEGFKKDNQVGFSNSDDAMIKFFIRWLGNCCGIQKDSLKLRLGINEQYRNEVKDIESYWSEILSIPLSQFQKPFFQKVRWRKIYDHPEEYHGVLRIRVSKSTDLLRKMHCWIEK
ncbi:hypothetical protein HYV22_03990 [Candidatus Gottesmanbacteria bacterium]|nr:hypothetical protein [Candidatus Gottesmanbacteria bacterium]